MAGTLNSNLVPAEVQRLFSFAALFEGTFSIDWVVEFAGLKASQILEALEEAIQQGWLIRNAPGVFHFADLQERQRWQSYLIPEEKELMHQKIAEFLLKEVGDDDAKILGAVPHLWHMSENHTKFQGLIKAGDAYLRSFHNEDALKCYTRVLEGLSDLRGEEEDLFFIATAIKYSKICTAGHDTSIINRILQEAILRSKRRNQKGSLAILKMQLSKNEWLRSRYPSALKSFKQGWALVKELDDPKLRRSATTFSTFYLYWMGRFREAVEIYEKDLSDVENNPPGGFPYLAATTMGRCYTYIGQVTQGLGMLDSIRTHCLEKNAHYPAAQATYHVGTTLLDIRRMDDALSYLQNAVKEAEEGHNVWIQMHGKLALAFAYSLQGEVQRSLDDLKGYLQDSREVHATVRPNPYLMEICWAMEQGKLPRISGLSLDQEIRRTIKDNNFYLKGIAYRHQALLERERGLPHETIVQALNLSLKWLEKSGHQMETAKTQKELVQQYILMGEKDKAEEIRLKAANILACFTEAMIPEDLRSLIHGDSPERTLDENLLKVILKLGREVVFIRDNKALVQQIISTANRITGAERGAIFLLEKGNPPKPLLRASKNLTSAQVGSPSFRSSMKMIEEVALTGKGRIMAMGSGDDPLSLFSEVIRSRICVPLILRDRVIGVLYHDNRLLSSAFKESDLELLSYFAAQAALAMDNAVAYEGIQSLNQKLQEEKLYFEEQHMQSLHLGDIVGESPEILHVLHQVNQVAKTEANVLILGETGVGKELVARAIHRHSRRRNKPFIAVNCSALPESLIPSELFGHEKGAFTGAVSRRIGRFELGDGGTIFLDEIGDLSAEVQARLLRVLQNKEFERVGGSKTIHSDFRLLAATNSDLEKDFKAGKFRADLYYRLNVFPIFVPPLRERKEDIPLLAHYFLKIHSHKMGKTFGGIREDEMNKLIEYDWPGNIRELENIIERGVILSTGSSFRVPKLGVDHPELGLSKAGFTLKENERHHILLALQKTGWRVRGADGAAELLGIPPSTLAFRMKKLEIQRPPGFSRRGRVPKASIEMGRQGQRQEYS